MNKDLFEKFKELNLPIGEYAIFGSGPMAARGLKQSNDIDAIVTDRIFNEYKNKPEWKLKEIGDWGVELISCGEIEMLNGWGPGKWDTQKIISEAEIINGLAFVKLGEVLKWKKMMVREKDKKDIELIEEYLNKKI